MDWGLVQLTSKTETDRRLRITLKVLNEVKVQFPQTKEFIEERLQQECLKENISVESNFSFL